MPNNQRGAILPFLVIILLIAGILITTKLVEIPQFWKPKASGEKAVKFTGPGVELNEAGEKITNSTFVLLQISSPFGPVVIDNQSGRDAQSTKEKPKIDLKLKSLFQVRNVLAQEITNTNDPTLPFPQPTPTQQLISAWGETTSLPKHLLGGIAGVYNGYLFAGGGYDISEALFSAKIGTDGTLSEWKRLSYDLPAGSQARSTMVMFNGYIYLVGGEVDYTTSANVYSSKIGFSGEIGPWQKLNSLPIGVARHSALVAGNHLMVIGGASEANFSETRLNTIYAAKLTPNGALEAWNRIADLPVGLSSTSVVGTRGYLYVAGGWDGTKQHDEVWRAKVHSSGNLEPWVQVSTLPFAVNSGAIFTSHSGYLFSVGGLVGFGPSEFSDAGVYAAKIGDDGSLGTWVKQNPLPQGLSYHSVVADIYNTKDVRNLYVLGGYSGTYMNWLAHSNIYHTKLLSLNKVTPSPVNKPPANLTLNRCEPLGPGSYEAYINWEDTSGSAISYWAYLRNLTQDSSGDVSYAGVMRAESTGGMKVKVAAKQVYDFSVHSTAPNYFLSGEHILIVCGYEKGEEPSGTAGYRIAEDKSKLLYTSFRLYQGIETIPYILQFRSGPNFVFGEFQSFTGETQTDMDSITYTGSPQEAICGGVVNIECAKGYSCITKGDYPDAGGICVKNPESTPFATPSN